MSDPRNRRASLLVTAAVAIAFASATASGTERPTAQRVAAASSSASKATDSDVKEIANYKLTMDAVRKAAKVARTTKQLKKARSDADRDNQDDEDDQNSDDQSSEDQDDDSSDAQSLDDMEAKIASEPAARNAIQAAGLSVREYLIINMAMLQSALAQYAVEQGADPAKIARDAGINPANVTFYKEHKAEIEALSADKK